MSREFSFYPLSLIKTLWKTSDNIAVKYRHLTKKNLPIKPAFQGLSSNYIILNKYKLQNPQFISNFSCALRNTKITSLDLSKTYIKLDRTLTKLGNNLNSFALVTALNASLVGSKVTSIKLAENNINHAYLISLIRNTNITHIEGINNLSQQVKQILMDNKIKQDNDASNSTDNKDFENKIPIILDMQRRRDFNSMGLNFIPPARQQKQPSKAWVHTHLNRGKKKAGLMNRYT